MAPERRSHSSGSRRLASLVLTIAFVAGLIRPAFAEESHGPASQARTAAPIRAPAPDSGVAWQTLTPAQQTFLAPLRNDWPVISSGQKRKWQEVAARVPKMSSDESARIQARMTGWAKLTPEQRGQARLHYQEAKQVPSSERQARWDAYQSLTPEQKQRLAAHASLAASATEPARRADVYASRLERSANDLPQPKSNIVPNPRLSTSPRQVAPTLLQARPGATTSPISRPAAPPAHQQSGMPKIAATPEFVNKSTLLPHGLGGSVPVGRASAAAASGVTPGR